MTVARSKRPELVDVRETRSAGRFEVRSSDSDVLILEGYASTFEPYEMYGGPAMGGWIEQLDPHAFDVTLREKPDLHLLVNHDGLPLARTKSGNLELSVDSGGLRVRATLDRSDPDVQRLEPKMRRKDMDEMSFAFRVKTQTWSAATGFDDDRSHRLITEVSLHKGDVSVVNWGANPTTSAALTSPNKKARKRAGLGRTRADAVAEMMMAQRKSEKGRVAAEQLAERALRGLGRLRATEADLAIHDVVPADGSRDPRPVTASDLGITQILDPARAAEEERARRAEFDAALARLVQRRDVLDAIGRRSDAWRLRKQIQAETAREQARRQDADVELVRLAQGRYKGTP